MAGDPISRTASPEGSFRVQELSGVGPERAALLAKLGIRTVSDLLLHRPRRWEDRTRFVEISNLQIQESATTRGKIVAMGIKRWKKGLKSVFEMIVEDSTGRLHCRWWNLPYMQKYFHQGEELFLYGKISSCRPPTMDHPETEVIDELDEPSIHLNRIVPVYPLTEGLSQRWLRSLIWRTLAEEAVYPPCSWNDSLAPGFLPHAQAIRQLHFPDTMASAEQARERLALEEFVRFQERLQLRRKKLEQGRRSIPCPGDNHLIRPFLKRIGFTLTEAQKSVLREIRKDVSSSCPMRRLLQGDVGSGKTVVAACAALMVLEGRHSVALMAPTQILAEQHFRTFQKWFEPLGLGVRLYSAGGRKGEETATSGSPVLHVGTHALIEQSNQLPDLGMVIIDEQHKFGVAQRERLVKKGRYPHLLVMTATPIPRTLALTLYGDLDVSVIGELPSGRIPIRTFVLSPTKISKAIEFLRSKLEEGRQAYIVYARIEESDQITLKGVIQQHQKLQKLLSPFHVGLLHGRLRREEQEIIMDQFREGNLHVLMATSVIEVGVDVPNATVMMIENADQFGLAQLHQLRGRIGRGTQESHCLLLAERKTEEARRRLAIMEQTADGFRIAEEDLKLRGPGELLGRDQSGTPPFRFADLAKDASLAQKAREIVRELERTEKGSAGAEPR